MRGVGLDRNIGNGRSVADQETSLGQIAVKDVIELSGNGLGAVEIEPGAEHEREPCHRGPVG
jgi:hypothetical protein